MLKILFVTDPMPVRSGPADFSWPFQIFRNIADSLEVSGLSKSYMIATDYLIDEFPSRCKSIKGSDLGINQTWPADWRDGWLEAMDNVDKSIFSKCVEIFEKLEIDVVYIWSKHDTIRAAALKAGAKVIHVEQGPIRAPTARYWIFDPLGIGPESFAADYINLCNERTSDYDVSYFAVDNFLSRCSTHKNRSINKKIIIALQMEKDINSILWSPFKSQVDFIQQMSIRLKKYKNIDVVVRQHPAAGENVGSDVEQLFGPGSYDDGKIDIWNSLGDYDGLININSTLGFEAGLAGIPVLSLGKSLFHKGIDVDALDCSIDKFIENVNNVQSEFSRSTSIMAILMKYFLVDDAIAMKPSFYHRLAVDFKRSASSNFDWFINKNGLKNILNKYVNEISRYRLSVLSEENHKRIMQISNNARLIDSHRARISELEHQNHLRILEIEKLVKYNTSL